MKTAPYLALVCVVTFGYVVSSVVNANWPEFRGPTADGKTTADVPIEFGEGKNVVCKPPV